MITALGLPGPPVADPPSSLRAECIAAPAGFPFPLGPFFERKTIRNEVSDDWDL